MKYFTITKKTPEKILITYTKGILNFQNMYSVYLFNKNPTYQEEIIKKPNFIFPDSKILSSYLGIKQIRGPGFTKSFFENNLYKNQKHFFIGLSKKDLKKLFNKFPDLNAKAYNPPYIKNIIFSKKEIEKIAKKEMQYRPKFIWVCVGNPKQEILANQLYRKYPAFYFNVGAGMDFFIGKKKEAPKMVRKVGLEWAYRLLTDFKYSRKKVWRSFLGLKYLSGVKVK